MDEKIQKNIDSLLSLLSEDHQKGFLDLLEQQPKPLAPPSNPNGEAMGWHDPIGFRIDQWHQKLEDFKENLQPEQVKLFDEVIVLLSKPSIEKFEQFKELGEKLKRFEKTSPDDEVIILSSKPSVEEFKELEEGLIRFEEVSPDNAPEESQPCLEEIARQLREENWICSSGDISAFTDQGAKAQTVEVETLKVALQANKI